MIFFARNISVLYFWFIIFVNLGGYYRKPEILKSCQTQNLWGPQTVNTGFTNLSKTLKNMPWPTPLNRKPCKQEINFNHSPSQLQNQLLVFHYLNVDNSGENTPHKLTHNQPKFLTLHHLIMWKLIFFLLFKWKMWQLLNFNTFLEQICCSRQIFHVRGKTVTYIDLFNAFITEVPVI